MSMHQVSKPRCANQSITEESGLPGTVRSKVGWPAIDEPWTKKMVPLVAWPEGGSFCHRNSLTSPFLVQCSTPLMRVLVSMRSLREITATYCTHILCKNPPRLRRGAPMPVGTLDTFPKLLMHHAATRGARPAIREKDLGIWQTWTWQRFADEVRALAAGLRAEGLQRG